jgi:hypothetical protein
MKPIKGEINLKITNNTALSQPVSMLGIIPNINSANNSNALYQFNFTGQSYVGITNVNINISNTSNPTIVVYNAPVYTQSIQGVVDALNSLNQGIFSYSGTTIYVSSSYYIYSNISIAGTSILGTTGINPSSIILDSSGNVFTTNTNSNNVSKITQSGVSTIFASVGNSPVGIVKDTVGNLYTCDASSNQVSKITPLGVVSILGVTNNIPSAITIDSAGNIYTANVIGNNLTKITPLGVATNYGNLNFETPQGMVIDSVGNVYVVCLANVVRKITPLGVSTNFGVFPSGDLLIGIAIDSLDNIYVSNQSNQIIYKLTPLAIQTTYGTSTNQPQQITIDSSNNIYCVNQNSTIDKILATGGTITISDLGLLGGSGYAIALDTFNNVYVTDYNLNRVYLIVQ